MPIYAPLLHVVPAAGAVPGRSSATGPIPCTDCAGSATGPTQCAVCASSWRELKATADPVSHCRLCRVTPRHPSAGAG